MTTLHTSTMAKYRRYEFEEEYELPSFCHFRVLKLFNLGTLSRHSSLGYKFSSVCSLSKTHSESFFSSHAETFFLKNNLMWINQFIFIKIFWENSRTNVWIFMFLMIVMIIHMI